MSKKKRRTPNLPPDTLLRSRLDALWQPPRLATQPVDQAESDLTAATRGLRPESAAVVLLAAYLAAGPQAQALLDNWLPGWIASQGYASAFEDLLLSGRLAEPQAATVQRWLAALGRAVELPAASGAGAFHSAYEIDDGSQAAVSVLWYTTPQRNRARGLQFLIDYNPPWDGAVKDVLVMPSKTPASLLRRFIDIWAERGQPMTPIGAAEAKRKIIRALEANRAAQIRLSRDLVLARGLICEHILTLPDLPDTPGFTAADFDALSQTGQRAEDIVLFEKTVARRVRLDDGSEVYVDASLANDDFSADLDLSGALDELPAEPGAIEEPFSVDLDDFDDDEA